MANSTEIESVRVSATSGRVKVVAEDRGDVLVRGGTAPQHDGGTVTVDAGPGRVEVRVPSGVDLVVGSHSGRVEVEGPLGAVAVVTESGRVTVEQAASVDVRTSSGRVEIGRVEGTTRVRSASGRITVDRTAGADVATDSGRIVLRSVSGRTTAHCVSGRIEVRLATAADVEAETVSGRITVEVADPVRAHAVSGPLPPDSEPHGDDCTIATRSVSGRVSVVRSP
ncbi:MAG: DUF4097 family beta strand repeat-containing protein [Acidimicrobiales bacterium]